MKKTLYGIEDEDLKGLLSEFSEEEREVISSFNKKLELMITLDEKKASADYTSLRGEFLELSFDENVKKLNLELAVMHKGGLRVPMILFQDWTSDSGSEFFGVHFSEALEIKRVIDDLIMGATLYEKEYFCELMDEDFEIVKKVCRVCGCTDDDCSECVEVTGEPCYWTEDDLCSRCDDEEDDTIPIDDDLEEDPEDAMTER